MKICKGKKKCGSWNGRQGVDRDGGGETRGNQSDYKDWKHHVHTLKVKDKYVAPHTFFFLTGCSLQNYFCFISGCEKKKKKNSNTSLFWIWCVIYIHGKIVVYVKSIQWHTHEVKTKDSRQIGATNMQSNNHWNYHLNRDTIHHSTSHANNSCKRRYQLPSLISVKNMGKKKLIKTTPTILCNFSTNFPCLVWTLVQLLFWNNNAGCT